MKRVLIVLMLMGAAAGLLVRSLPPSGRELTAAPAAAGLVRGAIHIHTRRSDGTGTPEAIARAAARAALKFVILTDHDHGAAEPAAPYYSNGVLVIEGVEISTDDGHVVALALPRAPYPLGGQARDVIEDVTRLGGFAIAAHPGSNKPDLRWTAWSAPFQGLEWLNGDSEWRDERVPLLLRGLFTYPVRRAGTLASLLDRPDEVLRRWDELTARRRVVALAAADAHARVALRSGEPDDPSPALHLPSYESMFRTFSITVSPVVLTADAAADARAVIDAIRGGHVYSSVDAVATPAAVTFSAASGRRNFLAGDAVPAGLHEIVLRVGSNAPADARILLLKDGAPLTTVTGAQLEETVNGDRGVYRVEIQLPGAPGDPPVPWVVSNPIYVGLTDQDRAPARPPVREVAPQYRDGPASEWRVETSARSRAAFDVVGAEGGMQLSLRWGLGGTLSESPFTALAMPAGPSIGDYDRLTFTARADRPMRLSVQVRIPGEGDGQRWHRSVYLDDVVRTVTIFFADMTPRGPTGEPRPAMADVRDVLFVVDTVNTRPGSSGQVWIDDVVYER